MAPPVTHLKWVTHSRRCNSAISNFLFREEHRVTAENWYVTTELVCVIERDVVQIQYLSGVVRNVFAIGFAPHIPLLT